MSRPAISVFTSTYNWPKALRIAILSVLQQSFSDFEYLIVGDHCTDETEELVNSFDDPRIRWINLKENNGNQADVYVETMHLARGDAIAYLNHDDIWFPEHLETVYKPLVERKLDVVSSLALSIKPPGINFRGLIGLPYVDAATDTLSLYPMTTNIIHQRTASDAVGGWKKWRSTPSVPTQEFFFRLRNHRRRFAVVPLVTSMKFHSGDRLNSYVSKSAEEQEYWFDQMQTNPNLRHEQMAIAIMCSILQEENPVLPTPTLPDPLPPGWIIEQWRRLRGLEPMLNLGDSEPTPSDKGLLTPQKPMQIAFQDNGTPIVDSTLCRTTTEKKTRT